MKDLFVKTQIHNEIGEIPDFPAEKVNALWRKTPPDSKDIVCDLFLLPFEGRFGKAEIDYAKSTTLFFLSLLIRDEIKDGAVFSEKEAVLYGDYLFTLAVAALPEGENGKDALPLLETIKTRLEKSVAHKKEGYREETAAADWGETTRSLALKAAEKAERGEGEKAAYAALGAALGALWGALYETGSASSSLYSEVEDKAAACPFGAELAAYAEKWRDQR